MSKRVLGRALAAALLVCVAFAACGCGKTASSAEKRFAEVFAEVGSLPANYVGRRVDDGTEKLVIVVTDDRPDVKRNYVELLGDEYADLIELEKHELSESELGQLADEIISYLNARGYACNSFGTAEGNVISVGVNEKNRDACVLADEISKSFGVHVIIEVMSDVELVSD